MAEFQEISRGDLLDDSETLVSIGDNVKEDGVAVDPFGVLHKFSLSIFFLRLPLRKHPAFSFPWVIFFLSEIRAFGPQSNRLLRMCDVI